MRWILVTAFCLAGCQKSSPLVPSASQEPKRLQETVVIDESVKQLSRDNAEFAVDLYHKLRQKPGNILFSPYSISAALAMTYDGARPERRFSSK